jgi:hypothetical protein
MNMSDIERMTDYVCNSYFGLTVNEAKILRWSMQGVGYRPDMVPDEIANELSACVDGAREAFKAMQRDYGIDPADSNPPADRDLEYHDLVEKLEEMGEDKARHLYFFMVGYLAAWKKDD